jgi:hypothetical protein
MLQEGWIELIPAGLASAAILLTLSLEITRKPRLKLTEGHWHDDPSGFRFVRIRVINQPLPKLLAKAFSRQVAAQCYVQLRLTDNGNKQELLENQPILAKWTRSREPLATRLIQDAPGKWTQVEFFDQRLISEGLRLDLVADAGGEEIDVAVKHEGESDCWAFSGMSYHPKFAEEGTAVHGWRNPDWRIPQGEWLLEVVVRSGQFEARKKFMLYNHGASRRGLSIRKAR